MHLTVSQLSVRSVLQEGYFTNIIHHVIHTQTTAERHLCRKRTGIVSR